MIGGHFQLPLTVFRNSSIADEPVFMLHFILQQGIFLFFERKKPLFGKIL